MKADENVMVTSGGRASEERRSKAQVTDRKDSSLKLGGCWGHGEEKKFMFEISRGFIVHQMARAWKS